MKSNLASFIKVKKNEALINANMNSNTQTPALCSGSPELETRSTAVIELLTGKNNLSLLERAVIELVYISGCRISQVVNLKSTNILKNGSINLIGSKGSESKIVMPMMFRKFWIDNKKYIEVTLYNFNRFYWYRLFKKYGLTYILPGKNNYSVTHSLRQLFIDSMDKSNIDKELIKTTIGHKNIKSQEYYKSKTTTKK